MRTVYLIDGYNLLYAMGVLHGRVGPTGLEKARLRLLGLVHGAHDADPSAVLVIFDAAHAPPGAPPAQDYQGVQVRFAVAERDADELIEQLIRQAAVPKQLTVVSDDRRIQHAGRRRQCTVWGCQEYLDWLDRRRRQTRTETPQPPEKQQRLSPQETAQWLAEFADLVDDPAMKDVFDPFGFEDEREE
jgi:predicted RNA-binding protein with PIN domain